MPTRRQHERMFPGIRYDGRSVPHPFAMLAPLLHSFYEAARQGSVTVAAKVLGLSQPTVTAHIRQLETMYKVELFHRRGGRIELTEAGAGLMPQVQRLLQNERDIDFALRNASRLAGTLWVGATGPYYILPGIAAFRQRYPATEIRIAIGNSREMLDALIDSRIDIAVSSQRDDDPRLVRQTLACDSLVMVVHRDHPLTRVGKASLADLKTQTLLLRESGSMTRQITESALRAADVRPATTIEIGSREAIHEAIRHDMGCSLMPAGEVPASPDLRVLPLEGEMPSSLEYVYYLGARSGALLIDTFIGLLADSRASRT